MPAPRVMVVDDDPSYGEFVRKVAEDCGCEVRLIGDGAVVAAEYARSQPELILLDLMMPGTDGVELLRILSDLGCTVPIVVMSGLDPKISHTVYRLGIARGLRMDRMLAKPFGAVALRGVIDDLKQDPEGDGCELDCDAAGIEASRRSITASIIQRSERAEPAPASCSAS